MAVVRGEEQWAARCVEEALGYEVRQHDDGSQPGMHDLEILLPDGSTAAMEVTAAADAESLSLWRVLKQEELWQEKDLAGGWSVRVFRSARGRLLRAQLPILLRNLEGMGVPRGIALKPHQLVPFDGLAEELGISGLFQSETKFPGSIYLTLKLPSEQTGGMVAATGDPLMTWLVEWMQAPEQEDNLAKLARSNAAERHLFVILPAFTTAPFVAADVLTREEPPLPTVPPALPEAVTHVWAMATWNTPRGLRWSPSEGWRTFDKP